MGVILRRGPGELSEMMGVQTALRRGRDRIVDLLGSDRSDPVISAPVIARNETDDLHLKLLLSFKLRPDSNCLDVGANTGIFLREIQRVAPHGHHIAYEPVPSLCAELKRQFPEIDVRQRALSSEDGQSTFVHVLDPNMEGLSGLTEGWVHQDVPTESIMVTTERLDDHLPDGWLPDFVKIDVEGAERLVLEGAMHVFRLAKPTIAFEHGWNGDQDIDRSEPIYNLICEDLGLRLFDMDGNGPLGLSQFLDGLRTRWNWVAHE
jgi:FkbM family methyltransferase